MARESGRIHDGRAHEALADLLAWRAGFARGNLGETAGRIRDEFGKSRGGKDAQARAAWRGCGGQGDDGDAHPEGVKRGGDAVVGDRIEADVDLIVELEILRAGKKGSEFDSVFGDFSFAEKVADAELVIFGFGHQEQP